MIVWAVTGLLVGWVVSERLRADSLGVFLVSALILPPVLFAAAHRLAVDVLWGCTSFWLAVQGAYFLVNLVVERRRSLTPGGPDGGALENA